MVKTVKSSKIKRNDMSLKQIITYLADLLTEYIGMNSAQNKHAQHTKNEKKRIKLFGDETKV